MAAVYYATGEATWGGWCDDTTSSATCAHTETVWITWASTADATASTPVIWNSWCDDTTNAVTLKPSAYVDHRTDAQRAADEARHEARLAQELADLQRRAVERRAATERARALLLSMLNVKQREQLQKGRFFEVIARNSRRRYRIREGTHGNVRLLDDGGREVTSYCAQPHGVPTEDSMLAQALMLEHDEEQFLKVANARRIA